MRVSFDAHLLWVALPFLAAAIIAASGCSPTKYRLQADRDAYDTIAERNFDPRWQAHDYSIEMDARSRYFDAYDPDHSPMPRDDPASHEYLHLVDGKKGWKHWHDNGDRVELENPAWREALGEYVEVGEDGAVKLNVDSALRMAYVHSPSHQRQLETLYLSALDVSAKRFRFDTQFFGGYGARYAHVGGLNPPGFRFDPATNSFVVQEAGPRNEQNRLTAGRPAFGVGAAPFGLALAARKANATAGELLVGFANSFVWEFTGGDANLATSLVGFNLVQPLLRGAGRDIALEDLTRDERNLLASLRAYSQFRQGFYTQVAIGELGVTGPQRFGSSTNLQSFSGSGGVNGYLGLLRQVQEIRNSKDNLSLQLRTLARLNALYDNELTDLVQLDQFRQGVESQRTDVLVRENAFELAKDRYKQGTLGLPPNLPIELDESQIEQFQLFPQEASAVQHAILELQVRVGDIAELMALVSKVVELRDQGNELPDDANIETVDRLLDGSLSFVEATQRRLKDLHIDLARLDGAGAAPEQAITDVETGLIELVRERLREGPASLEEQFEDAETRLQRLQDALSAETKDTTVSENIVWLRELLRIGQGCLVVQSRARRLDVEPKQALIEAFELIEPVRQLFVGAREDLTRMDAAVPMREQPMDEEQKDQFRRDRAKLRKRLEDLESGEQGFDIAVAKLEGVGDGFSEQTRGRTVRGLTAWIGEFLQIVERLTLVPAQARLEVIMVDAVELKSEDAFQIALANRLDFMNGRAALVDQWRLIQVNADALQAVLNVTANGDISTARNNAVSFRAPTSTLRLGLEFDAPFTRLLERNAYRESLIDYQQSRRDFIQSRDSLQLGLRALLRNLEQLRQNLEIQRRAVTIAMRRVDQTQLELTQPRPPAQPGVRPSFSQTTAINLLSAQRALQSTQDNFLSTWLTYYATRIRLYRELGIMLLGPDGRWMEHPIGGSEQDAPSSGGGPGLEELPLPPTTPTDEIDAVN